MNNRPTARKLPDYGDGFFYGINYAWHHFGGDFGGIAAWGQQGVSANREVYREELHRMRSHGARAVRWWMLPELRGEGVILDALGDVMGLGPHTLLDVEAALQIADEVDMDVMFTQFSFDNFRRTRLAEPAVTITGLAPLVIEASRRKQLIETVVRPLARAIAQSACAARMVSWDVMNEPEWALKPGPGVNGDPSFRTGTNVDDPVTHAQMSVFLADVISVLRDETPGVPISVGSAATVWSHAWRSLDTDYHQFHIYDWVDAECVEGVCGRPFAYDKSPAALGLDDKPLVVGEFWMHGLQRTSHEDLVITWRRLGYAGAMSWSFSEHKLRGEALDAGLLQMRAAART